MRHLPDFVPDGQSCQQNYWTVDQHLQRCSRSPELFGSGFAYRKRALPTCHQQPYFVDVCGCFPRFIVDSRKWSEDKWLEPGAMGDEGQHRFGCGFPCAFLLTLFYSDIH